MGGGGRLSLKNRTIVYARAILQPFKSQSVIINNRKIESSYSNLLQDQCNRIFINQHLAPCSCQMYDLKHDRKVKKLMRHEP